MSGPKVWPAFACLVVSGCLLPNGSPDPSECAGLAATAGPQVATPTAFFGLEPGEAAARISAAFGDNLTAVQRGPEETGPGRWWQIWETGQRGYITVHWGNHIDSVRVQGGGLRDLTVPQAMAHLPVAVALAIEQTDAEDGGWRASQATPIGPMPVAFAWAPQDVADLTMSTTYTFAQASWIDAQEAADIARLAGGCDRDRYPDGIEPRDPVVVDGRLAFVLEVVHHRCSTEYYSVDATSGAVLDKQFGGWCG